MTDEKEVEAGRVHADVMIAPDADEAPDGVPPAIREMIENQKDLEPDIARALNENFWELFVSFDSQD